MKPVKFKYSNTTLNGGDGARYGTVDAVDDLPIYRSNGQIISCWKAGWRERLAILFSGHVWLHVLTNEKSHNPVLISGTDPFSLLRK